jgi:hypothetical protein
MLASVRRLILPCGLLVAVAASAGCSSEGLKFMAYLLFGDQDQKVKAEFKGLSGKTVAVVVYTDLRTQYEYPDLNLTLSSAICGLLKDNVEKIKLIPATRVVHYQDQNIYWPEMDKTELGKALGADCVIYVPLEEFTTRVPDSSYLYHGRAACEPSVYDVSKPPREARVYKSEDKIRVEYPEHEPSGMVNENDRQIRDKTEKQLAERVAWKFYDHREKLAQ